MITLLKITYGLDTNGNTGLPFGTQTGLRSGELTANFA